MSEAATAAPVYFRFGAVNRNWKKPLSEMVRREASAMGVIASPSDELPRVLVAIDDMFVDSRAASRLEKDLAEMGVDWLGVACRPADEAEVASLLTGAGIGFVTRYVGRLNSADVRLYADRVDPTNAKTLAGRVVTTLKDEHLPPHPPTVLMLLGILHKDKRAASIPTPSLVDQFVELLIAELPPRPSRMTLDPQDLCAILEYFAHELAVRRASEMPIPQFLELLAQYQREVDWQFDSSRALDRFVAMRILALRSDSVRFTQASYLYLFVARYARSDRGFKQDLLLEPFFFSDPLVHYSALVRNDEEMLAAVRGLVDNLAIEARPGTAFIDACEDDVVEIPEGASFELSVEDHGEQDDPDSDDSDSGSRQVDLLDHYVRPPEPFAVERKFKPESFWGSMVACEFAAAVLRNSDQVKNLELKSESLNATLAALGRAVDLAEVDAEYGTFCAELMKMLNERTELKPKENAAFDEFIRNKFPSLLASSILGSRLSGSKIGQGLDRIIVQSVERGDARVATLGLALSLMLGTPNVTKNLKLVAAKYRRVSFTREICVSIALNEYTTTMDKALKAALEDFIVEVNMASMKFSSVSQRGHVKSEILRRLRDLVLRSRREAGRRSDELEEVDRELNLLVPDDVETEGLSD